MVRYKYSKDDEEIYKEFMEINNELIPHILKADGEKRHGLISLTNSVADRLVQDPECFGSLVQFYDGLCSWEEESSTPVLHIGWVKPIVKCFAAFDFATRAKLDIAILEEEGNSALLSLSDLGLTNTKLASFPDRLNNNYKDSVEDCDIRKCDKEAEGGHYDLNLLKIEEKSIYPMPTKPDFPSARTSNFRCEEFERMHVNKLLRLASLPQSNIDFSEVVASSEKRALINHIIEHAGDRLFNVDFLLGNCVSMGEAFLEPGSTGPLPTSQTFTFLSNKNTEAIESTKATLLAEASSSRAGVVSKGSHLRTTSLTKTSTASTSLTSDGRVKVAVFSSKIGDLKPLLLCEKLNSSALHLHLTAQSQTEVKKSRNSSFETDFANGGRVKRQRRE